MALVAPVKDGQINISESSQSENTEKKVGSNLDKDDFLLLLVTQMKYQDPLEPTDNTEYVAQLAQFSELEQMQNLNSTTVNTSAFSLVGKMVRIEQTSATGETVEVEGMVDYVSKQNNQTYVSVNGEKYKYDDIVEVMDDTYYISQFQPSVKKQKFTFLHQDPQDIAVAGISLGKDNYKASSIAVALVDASGNTTNIDPKYLKYKDGKLTIDKSALAAVTAGTYNIAFVFDDSAKTVDYTSVELTVKGNTTVSKTDDNTETKTEDKTESAADDKK